jgi:hypothetical protein
MYFSTLSYIPLANFVILVAWRAASDSILGIIIFFSSSFTKVVSCLNTPLSAFSTAAYATHLNAVLDASAKTKKTVFSTIGMCLKILFNFLLAPLFLLSSSHPVLSQRVHHTSPTLYKSSFSKTLL